MAAKRRNVIRITVQKARTSYSTRHSAEHGSYVMANGPERRVVHPRVNENSREETVTRGAGHNVGAKNVSGETEARKPSLADFGWDFPFNSPSRLGE
jgi:hypothetical protein